MGRVVPIVEVESDDDDSHGGGDVAPGLKAPSSKVSTEIERLLYECVSRHLGRFVSLAHWLSKTQLGFHY